MTPACTLCDGAHGVDDCPYLRAESTWNAGALDEGAARAGEEEPLRALLAARALEPLVSALDAARREVDVLETVNTDDEQRQRLSRSRKLVKAIHHVRHRRLEMLEPELSEAERARPGDPLTAMVAGYVRMVEGRFDAAVAHFEAATETLDTWEETGDDLDPARIRLDALIGWARSLVTMERYAEARERFAEVVRLGEGDRRAEARYQIARCLLAEARGDA